VPDRRGCQGRLKSGPLSPRRRWTSMQAAPTRGARSCWKASVAERHPPLPGTPARSATGELDLDVVPGSRRARSRCVRRLVVPIAPTVSPSRRRLLVLSRAFGSRCRRGQRRRALCSMFWERGCGVSIRCAYGKRSSEIARKCPARLYSVKTDPTRGTVSANGVLVVLCLPGCGVDQRLLVLS
jgi:hypothetical protein